MTTPTFTPPTEPGPSSTTKTTTPRALIARLGDGFSQRSPDGLNYIGRSVSLDWPALSSTDADTIESFFIARGGAETFFYTLPLEATQYKWTNGPIKRTYLGASVVRLNVTLTQEFDLGASSEGLILSANALLAGVGSFTARASGPLKATAILAGVGSLSASANLNLSANVLLAGVGTLSALGNILSLHQFTAQATLTGSSSLAATGALYLTGSAKLAGTSSLAASAILALTAKAAFAGVGSLSVWSGNWILATGYWADTGIWIDTDTWIGGLAGSATLAGVGSLSAYAGLIQRSNALLAGVGSLSAVGNIQSIHQLSMNATLAGSSSIIASALHTPQTTSLLAGSGNISANATISSAVTAWQGTAILAATGSLTARASIPLAGFATLAGAAALAASASLFRTASATFAGSSSLSANSYSPQASQFIKRITDPGAARRALYAALIDGLVADGVWSKLFGLWIHAADITATAKINLKSSSYICTQTGTLTFTADHGYTGNGSTGYLDTGFDNKTGFSQNDWSFGCYCLTARTANSFFYAMGADDGAAPRDLGLLWNPTLNYFCEAGGIGAPANTGLLSNTAGMHIVSVTGSTTGNIYRNGNTTPILTLTGTTAAVTTAHNIYLFARASDPGPGADTFTTDQQAAEFVGSGLTATDTSNLASRINTYMTALGVNVY
jgi:phage-related protein